MDSAWDGGGGGAAAAAAAAAAAEFVVLDRRERFIERPKHCGTSGPLLLLSPFSTVLII